MRDFKIVSLAILMADAFCCSTTGGIDDVSNAFYVAKPVSEAVPEFDDCVYHRLVTCVHEREAARPIGGFNHARFKTSLTDGSYGACAVDIPKNPVQLFY